MGRQLEQREVVAGLLLEAAANPSQRLMEAIVDRLERLRKK